MAQFLDGESEVGVGKRLVAEREVPPPRVFSVVSLLIPFLFIIPYCEPHGSHHEAGDAQGDYNYYPVLHFLKGNGDVPRLLVVIDIISSV